MSEPAISFWITALHAISEPFTFFCMGVIVTAPVVYALRRVNRVRQGTQVWQASDTSMPTVMADIGADMDQLHSQIAVATRRLEMSVEQMKLRTSSQLSEIGKTSEAIGRLKGELAERTTAFAELQGKERAVSAQLITTEAELVAKTKVLNELEKTIAERKTELARFMAEFNVHPEIGKLRQVHAAEIQEIKAENAQVEDQLRQSKEQCLTLQCKINVMEKQVETTWASERMANAVLRERINDVASEVVRVATALEGLHSPIDAMVSAKLPAENVPTGTNGANGHNGFGRALGSLLENNDGSRTPLVHRIRALRKRTAELPAPG